MLDPSKLIVGYVKVDCFIERRGEDSREEKRREEGRREEDRTGRRCSTGIISIV